MVSESDAIKVIGEEFSFIKLISPEEVAEAIKMRADGELSSTGMKTLLLGLYKERLNICLRELTKKK